MGDIAQATKVRPGNPLRFKILLAILGRLSLCLITLLPWLLRTHAAATHLEAGMLLMNQRNPTGAETEWKAALAVSPANKDAYIGLGKLYLAQGRLREAHATLNHLADLDPGEQHVLCDLAAIEYRAATNTAQAEAARQDALRAAALE